MLTFSSAIYLSIIVIVKYTRLFKITYETFFCKSYGFKKKFCPLREHILIARSPLHSQVERAYGARFDRHASRSVLFGPRA